MDDGVPVKEVMVGVTMGGGITGVTTVGVEVGVMTGGGTEDEDITLNGASLISFTV